MGSPIPMAAARGSWMRNTSRLPAVRGAPWEGRREIVTVLAEVGENVAEIDEARAEAARRRAAELLAKGPPPDTDEYLALESALRRSTLRLEAVRRYRRGTPRPPRIEGSEGR